MNFTREPILETIITPKEGYKLMVRSSKGTSQEEYAVDALEVVSFGPAIFYRCQERPKPFLLPVGDFEVVEIKEARVVLKNANLERAIKIGGGREAPLKPMREAPASHEKREHEESEGGSSEETPVEHRGDKKRDRHRRRRRRGGGDGRHEQREMMGQAPHHEAHPPAAERAVEEAVEGGDAHDETQVSSSTFSTLFPPPSKLISQTLGRHKDQAVSEEPVLPPVEEEPRLEKEKREDDDFPTNNEPHLSSRSELPASFSQPIQGTLSDENRFK